MQHQSLPADISTSSLKNTDYFPLLDQLGPQLFAFFSHYELNYFYPGPYQITFQANTYEINLPNPILKNNHNGPTFYLLSETILGKGTATTVIKADYAFRIDYEHQTVLGNFAPYAIKRSTYKIETHQEHKNNLAREYDFTQLGAPYLDMQPPVLLNEVGEFGIGSGFLAMNALTGRDLEKVITSQYSLTIEDEDKTRPKLTTHDLLTIILNLGHALADLHQHKNLIHRDFKPANIWIGDDLSVRLFDFAFAKKVGEVDEKICGSLRFLAPKSLESILNAIAKDGYKNKKNLLTEENEMWAYGVIIGLILNVLTAKETNQLKPTLKYTHSINSTFTLVYRKIPGLEPAEVKCLINLVNTQLVRCSQDKLPMANEFLPLLEELLEPILKRLAEIKHYSSGSATPIVANVIDPQIKLSELKNLLLFQPTQSNSVPLGQPLKTIAVVEPYLDTARSTEKLDENSAVYSGMSEDSASKLGGDLPVVIPIVTRAPIMGRRQTNSF